MPKSAELITTTLHEQASTYLRLRDLLRHPPLPRPLPNRILNNLIKYSSHIIIIELLAHRHNVTLVLLITQHLCYALPDLINARVQLPQIDTNLFQLQNRVRDRFVLALSCDDHWDASLET